jgi:cytochrome c oxidase assembly protein subunit 15
VLLWLYGRRVAPVPQGRLALGGLLLVASAQAALGIATLLLVVPLPLAVAHQAGAMLLVTAAVVAVHTLGRAPSAPRLDGLTAAAL